MLVQPKENKAFLSMSGRATACTCFIHIISATLGLGREPLHRYLMQSLHVVSHLFCYLDLYRCHNLL